MCGPEETGREAENADQDAAARGIKGEKADRLSKRYFRICSWNCASANKRGAVLEKMVYDFDVVCLQETRTCTNRPLVLQGFTVIQRHQSRGMTIVVRSDLSKTVSLLNLDRWSTSSRELQGIRIENPDERHKSLILINAHIHPFTCITGAIWDFLEEMEKELGDTIIIYGVQNQSKQGASPVVHPQHQSSSTSNANSLL